MTHFNVAQNLILNMLEKRIVQKYEFLISDDVTGYDVTDFL